MYLPRRGAGAQAAGRLSGGSLPGSGAGQCVPRRRPQAWRAPGVQALLRPAHQRPPAEREAPPAPRAAQLAEGTAHNPSMSLTLTLTLTINYAFLLLNIFKHTIQIV